MVKFGGGALEVTVRLIVVLWVNVPDVPVTVTVTVPSVAVLLAVKVKVLFPPVVLAGLNAAVTPAGRPDADKLTVPVNPFSAVTVTVLVPLEP